MIDLAIRFTVSAAFFIPRTMLSIARAIVGE
jgi:hypothetical protein